jgi:hypothetical protein
MLKQKKVERLKNFSPNDNAADYLAKARPHLEELLERRNIQHELLNTKQYSQHLNPTETRNLTLDISDTTKELSHITTHLLSLRQAGPSAARRFDPKTFTEVASTIRDGNNLMTQNPYLWEKYLHGYP